MPEELLQKDTKTKRPWMSPRQYLEVALDFLLEDAQRNISMDSTLGLGTEGNHQGKWSVSPVQAESCGRKGQEIPESCL